MANVLIVAYLLIVLALIGVILIQRSEGGGLGMGSGSNGLVSVRGSANLLTRTTAILATLFFATAIGLTILAELDRSTQSILEQAADPVDDGSGQSTVPTSVLDALNSMNGDSGSLDVPATETTPAADPGLAVPDPALAVPTTEAPAATEAPATTAPATTEAPAATAPATTETPAAPTETAPAQTPAAPTN